MGAVRTQTILSRFGGDAEAFDEFVGASPERFAVAGHSGTDLVAVLDAAQLVVIELGFGDRGRAAVVARAVALAWADGLGGFDQPTLMETLEIPSGGAMRTALSRVRRRLVEEPLFARAVDRSAELAAAPSVLRRGSDPWRNGQRAARAAS